MLHLFHPSELLTLQQMANRAVDWNQYERFYISSLNLVPPHAALTQILAKRLAEQLVYMPLRLELNLLDVDYQTMRMDGMLSGLRMSHHLFSNVVWLPAYQAFRGYVDLRRSPEENHEWQKWNAQQLVAELCGLQFRPARWSSKEPQEFAHCAVCFTLIVNESGPHSFCHGYKSDNCWLCPPCHESVFSKGIIPKYCEKQIYA